MGAGVAALMVNDTIIYPWCYKNQEILDNGPLRFTVKLEFTPLTVKGDSTVVETRLITLDAGSHLNKTAVSYSNLKETLPIVAGIVLHEPDGAVVADAANGYITYVDPTTGPDNGKIFMGAAVPAVVKDAKPYFSPRRKRKNVIMPTVMYLLSAITNRVRNMYIIGDLHGIRQISRLPMPGTGIWLISPKSA